MVSFWLWRSDPSSPASFEKTLSALSEKINKNQADLDMLRYKARRYRGFTTLYLMLAYLLYGIVALLVIGQQNMGPLEWTGLAGGPVVVYITRQVITAFFNWRIESVTSRLQGQQDERTRTIQKLKDATKYNSTLELLEKYGGEPKKDRQADDDGASTSSRAVSRPVSRQEHRQQHRQQQGRTNLPPPPTANIQRRESANRPVTPNLMEPGAEFAPNAEFSPSQRGAPLPLPSGFDTSSLQGITSQQRTNSYPGPQFTQYEQPSQGGPQWYDRFLDLLLGEDEMAPRNRIALVCARCRLVNGQAAPGTKSLSEVGMWRCMGCGAMNGEADEGKKIIKELMEEKEKERKKKLATATTSYSRGEAVVEDEEANENRRMKDRGDLAT